jgi:NAD(P)-dependent dehydrogenase (short-subunit alcohol dehydrogenase family)
LDDKVAVVTGGAKGIGMFYSAGLAEAGANVVVADVDPKAVSETSARLMEEHPGRILGVTIDVTKRDSLKDMVKQIDALWGKINIVVNNAGLYATLQSRRTPWGIPDEEFDRVMAVNIRGIYACTEECLPLMEKEGWGRVINIASGLAFKGSAGLAHYAATKGAVVNLTRSMAPALGPLGINVNALAPGGTESPTVVEARQERAAAAAAAGQPAPAAQTRGASADGQPAPQRRGGGLGSAARILDRTEYPEDLVGTLIYLASPASDFVTGQTIVVDGGTYFN